jgi:hypothetical protein
MKAAPVSNDIILRTGASIMALFLQQASFFIQLLLVLRKQRRYFL